MSSPVVDPCEKFRLLVVLFASSISPWATPGPALDRTLTVLVHNGFTVSIIWPPTVLSNPLAHFPMVRFRPSHTLSLPLKIRPSCCVDYRYATQQRLLRDDVQLHITTAALGDGCGKQSPGVLEGDQEELSVSHGWLPFRQSVTALVIPGSSRNPLRHQRYVKHGESAEVDVFIHGQLYTRGIRLFQYIRPTM
ncbi:hypothetical protein B0H14DRAFT_1308331 [Mycena olivaceomarginata]|nr:hypothetical protein B0H14DRAFT_1308331 [Mycena olivaceomarginata]